MIIIICQIVSLNRQPHLPEWNDPEVPVWKMLNECMCFCVLWSTSDTLLGFLLNIVGSNPAAHCKKEKEEKSPDSKGLRFHRVLTFFIFCLLLLTFSSAFTVLLLYNPCWFQAQINVALVAFGVKICYCRSHDPFTTICLESCTLPQKPGQVYTHAIIASLWYVLLRFKVILKCKQALLIANLASFW